MAAINWEMSNITYNLMHEFEIDHSFEETIKNLWNWWKNTGLVEELYIVTYVIL